MTIYCVLLSVVVLMCTVAVVKSVGNRRRYYENGTNVTCLGIVCPLGEIFVPCTHSMGGGRHDTCEPCPSDRPRTLNSFDSSQFEYPPVYFVCKSVLERCKCVEEAELVNPLNCNKTLEPICKCNTTAGYYGHDPKACKLSESELCKLPGYELKQDGSCEECPRDTYKSTHQFGRCLLQPRCQRRLVVDDPGDGARRRTCQMPLTLPPPDRRSTSRESTSATGINNSTPSYSTSNVTVSTNQTIPLLDSTNFEWIYQYLVPVVAVLLFVVLNVLLCVYCVISWKKRQNKRHLKHGGYEFLIENGMASNLTLQSVKVYQPFNSDQTPADMNDDQTAAKVYSDQTPANMNGDQTAAKVYSDQTPANMNGDQTATKVYSDQTPANMNGDQTVIKVYSDKTPANMNGDQTATKVYSDQTPANMNGDQTVAKVYSYQTPANKNGDQTPANKNGDQTPANMNGDQTPANMNGDQTPANMNGDQTAVKVNADQTLANKNGDQTLANKNGDQTPANMNGDQTPANMNGDQTLANKNGDQTPANMNGDQTPANMNGDQTPANKNGDQTPANMNGDQTLANKNGDQTPANMNGDQTADKVYSDQTLANMNDDQTPADMNGDQTVPKFNGDKTTTELYEAENQDSSCGKLDVDSMLSSGNTSSGFVDDMYILKWSPRDESSSKGVIEYRDPSGNLLNFMTISNGSQGMILLKMKDLGEGCIFIFVSSSENCGIQPFVPVIVEPVTRNLDLKSLKSGLSTLDFSSFKVVQNRPEEDLSFQRSLDQPHHMPLPHSQRQADSGISNTTPAESGSQAGNSAPHLSLRSLNQDFDNDGN